jgi:two-component system response regulator CpxR
MVRVLVIDDDVELGELLREYLDQEGHAVATAVDGPTGLDRALSEAFDLVVLDVMLPGLDGFELLRRLRTRSQVPVIMLTARGEEVDRIVGLEMGADDYLPKPFNPRELVARMRAVLRRMAKAAEAGDEAGSEVVAVDDLELDPGARLARCSGEEVALTGIEFSVLQVLVRSAGNVVSRDDLSRQALDRRSSAFDRSLDVHISNLRRKLGPLPGGRERIKTVRGVGYIYVKPAPSEDDRG